MAAQLAIPVLMAALSLLGRPAAKKAIAGAVGKAGGAAARSGIKGVAKRGAAANVKSRWYTKSMQDRVARGELKAGERRLDPLWAGLAGLNVVPIMGALGGEGAEEEALMGAGQFREVFDQEMYMDDILDTNQRLKGQMSLYRGLEGARSPTMADVQASEIIGNKMETLRQKAVRPTPSFAELYMMASGG
jgi:hypothetical protein